MVADRDFAAADSPYLAVSPLLNWVASLKRVSPPGPPRHPYWGNLFKFPRVRLHETFSELQKLWGMPYPRYLAPYHRKETPRVMLGIENSRLPGD